MPIRVQNDLPVKEILEKENIFVMDENRAVHQDIRPIKIGLLNLMPLKEDTELQLLRSLSNTPLQVDIVFLAVKNHVSKNTSANHLNRFYENFENVKDILIKEVSDDAKYKYRLTDIVKILRVNRNEILDLIVSEKLRKDKKSNNLKLLKPYIFGSMIQWKYTDEFLKLCREKLTNVTK